MYSRRIEGKELFERGELIILFMGGPKGQGSDRRGAEEKTKEN